MQMYDLGMLAVLLVTTIIGFRKGVAMQIASILSLVLSYVAALKYADAVLPYINVQPPLNRFVAMLIVYLGVSAAIWLIFRGIKTAIERVALREFDHQVGGLCGAAKGVLLCTVITFFVVTTSNAGRDTVLRSKSGYYISWFLHEATPIVPKELQAVLGPYLNRLEDRLDPSRPADPALAQNPAASFNGAFQQQIQQDLQQAAEQGIRQAAEPFINRAQQGVNPYLPATEPPSVYQPQPVPRSF